MKFRRRNAPILLLLVPFASALASGAQDNSQSTLTKNTQPQEPGKVDPIPSPVLDTTKPKYDVGTKDAPVDGKDGKPHAGPWVGDKDSKSKSDSKDEPKGELKGGSEDAELVLGAGKAGKEDLSELVVPGGGKIPQVNDGVMDDPNRELPKHGTTGTEGGVSEKDKARKAQEGQTGEKVEKKPDSPKEAPPLPPSEQAKINTEKAKTKNKDDGDKDDSAEGLAGLEVCFWILLL